MLKSLSLVGALALIFSTACAGGAGMKSALTSTSTSVATSTTTGSTTTSSSSPGNTTTTTTTSATNPALTVTPTTTLAAETGNNTSGASTWTTSTNGDVTPGNVSQEDVHKLLYNGESTKVYAHYLGWWGTGGGHINIGYNSATLAQAHAQISDMMNRGIDGLIIDWYGAGNTHIDQASKFIKQDAETRGGKFTFAIMEDQGAVHTCANTSGCNATQAVINDLNYINTTYVSSPAYMRVNGRPVIFTFDTENLPNINWTTVLAGIQGNPMIVLRNDQGFRISWTSGSYSWVSINKSNQDDWGQGYLDDFYNTDKSYASEMVYTGVWKGFNDTLASWSENRIMSQNCGQVWLDTFNEMNKSFSTNRQPTAVQLVTWNDYEEGTEIETGIDNCVSVAGSMAGSTVEWSISGGQENTIDHYTVFLSTDGENLMKLADVPAGTHQLDLSTYGLGPANYTLYVKAIGKPSILNKMSGAILYSISNQPPVATLSVTPTSGTAPVTVTASTVGSKDPDGTIAATSINFGDGTVVSAASAAHTYSAAGTYTVTATVTDNNGASSSTHTTVSVTAMVAQPFIITPVMPVNGATVGQSVHFMATSSSPSSPVTALRIYVDNQSMYTVNATALDATLPLKAGAHYVVLQGWNQAGTVAKTPMNITVQTNQPPVVTLALTPTSGLGPLTVSATASGSDSDGTIASTSINFGDGTIVNGASASHIYNSSGTFTVTATATDNSGAAASASATVNVMGLGVIISRPARGSIDPSPVTITASATAPTPIVAMRVYVDNVAKYSLNSFSSKVATLNTSLTMSQGPHYVVVQAWDTKGNVYKSPLNITVQ